MAIGDKNVSFSTPPFIFISKKLIHDSELLNTDEATVDLFNCLVSNSNCEKDVFRKMRIFKIHSNLISFIIYKWRPYIIYHNLLKLKIFPSQHSKLTLSIFS